MASGPYWQDETPVVVRTAHNTFRWYRQAGRLHVCLPDYTDRFGRSMSGKTVGIYIDDILGNNNALSMFQKIFDNASRGP